ncbi:MAG: N-acetyltransferase [Rhizobiales bacterium]|nr:N-acetyltransferase [Hyphomicrobiales bacterium]
MIVRPADRADLQTVQAIYAIEVLEGTASFETAPPDVDEIGRRYQSVLDAGLPYVVADLDGRIGGYAYAAPYRTRPAYHLTVENSVYVARDSRGRGIGSVLLETVIERSTAAGKRQMVAVIGDSANHGSIRLHEKAGFRLVGNLEDVGFKFGRFIDTVIMQRSLCNDRAIG